MSNWTNDDFVTINSFFADMKAILADPSSLTDAGNCSGCREVMLADLEKAKASFGKIMDWANSEYLID